MIIERVYDEDLAQASYLVGCPASGEAVVIDPRRDVSIYLEQADRLGLRVIATADTHVHADYVSGLRELAAQAKATAYVSGEADSYMFSAERIRDADEIRIGTISLRAIHTPGHTPEHLAFIATDTSLSASASHLFSGDFMFVGDVGRPDLVQAGSEHDAHLSGAHQMVESLNRVLDELDDAVSVHPGHGSGSVCGRQLGTSPSTTIGRERQTAWWAPFIRSGDRNGFVQSLLTGQPGAPSYFRRMKRLNSVGAPLLGDLPTMREITESERRHMQLRDEVLVVDTRDYCAVRSGTPIGALAIPATGKTAVWGAWVVDTDLENRPLLLIANDRGAASRVRDHLVRVGIDSFVGYATDLAGFSCTTPAAMPVEGVSAATDAFWLDIRESEEHVAGHVPGSVNIPAGQLLRRSKAELPRDRSIISFCQSGTRNQIVAQALRRDGFDVVELEGSFNAWVNAGKPVASGVSPNRE